MADFDSADVLSRLRATLQIGSNTADATDASLYTLLSNGQRRIAQILANVAPQLNMIAPQALTSGDSGATYTLSSYPLSNFELYDGSPNGSPIYPVGYEYIGANGYVLEGLTIRWPGGRTRTFANGLYARYNPVPVAITASVAPSIKPSDAQQGVVYAAAEEFAMQGGAMDPSPYSTALRRFLYGDPNTPGDVGLIGRVQTQSRRQGLQSAMRGFGGAWWRGGDFLSGPA